MKAGKRKVIISCAVTGFAHTPSMSEFLPVTPEQITGQAVEAARAGASILHLHARNPVDGRPTFDAAVYDLFVPAISAQTDAVINIPLGGGARATLDERLAYPLRRKPELCTIDIGSTNYAFQKSGRGITEWKFSWERPYIEQSEDFVLGNTSRETRALLAALGGGYGTRLEFVCHEPGHLHHLAQFLDEGLIRGPLFIQCALAGPDGLNADPEALFVMRAAADRLFGRGGYEFSVLASGRHQIAHATMGAIMGGHVRVGLGDSLYLGKGLLAASCAAQVLKMRRILEELSFEVASPDEAREILHIGAATRAFEGQTREAGANG
ncbi:uncharacterized protein (DUF849 family) [Hoeflea marina]|uniref:Uncharacterized protein (DUF849 family) n=2 Tax=Hoeflea marina TaxID=274592 RepID=A0A317PDP9_9HYPH|nr:uncharacterized protein (DUF849 family) [Hoeflea marina]